MSVRTRVLVPAALLIALAGLAGCGGSSNSNTVPSKAEYKQTYASLNSNINALGLAVGTAINKSSGKSNKDIAKEFADLADRARAAAKKVDDATPPADANIQKQQAALVAGLNTAADDLDAISKASEKKDFKAAGTAAGKLTRDNAGVATPHAQLNKIVLGLVPAPVKTTTKAATTTTAP